MTTTWTEERVADLKNYHAEGNSAGWIANTFGDMTRSAVIGKLHRLGLTASYAHTAKKRPRSVPKARALKSEAEVRLTRTAGTRTIPSHVSGLLRSYETRKPVTLAKLNLPELVD